MPTNLYGPNDNYDLLKSHFFPALISKIYKAQKTKSTHIEIWGDGTPKRELMYVDDVAEACEFFLKKKTKHSLINIGSGDERTILGYGQFILRELKTEINIKFDKKKPNGTPRKKLNSNLANKYGWFAKTELKEGFKLTYKSFLKNINSKNL